MDKGSKFGKMDQATKANFWMEQSTEKVHTYFLTEFLIKAISSMIYSKAKAF